MVTALGGEQLALAVLYAAAQGSSEIMRVAPQLGTGPAVERDGASLGRFGEQNAVELDQVGLLERALVAAFQPDMPGAAELPDRPRCNLRQRRIVMIGVVAADLGIIIAGRVAAI